MNVSSGFVAAVLVLLGLGLQGNAQQAPEQAHFHRDIYVESGERVGELSCIDCSIHVRGQVEGDVAAILGNVSLKPGASIKGEVAVIAGNLTVDSDARIGGETAVIGGVLHRAPNAYLGGEIVVMSGPLWTMLVFVAPVVFLFFFVVLIIWVVHLLRRRSATGVYAQRQ
jgi:predicted acyltransferase (DUF342 family)